MELGEKLGGFGGVVMAEASGAQVTAAGGSHVVADAASALVNLGYPQYTAYQALQAVQLQFPEAAATLRVEDLIRLALQSLAAR
jgi:Holliday junction resolvasome RuvABC DNA-binding subunit